MPVSGPNRRATAVTRVWLSWGLLLPLGLLLPTIMLGRSGHPAASGVTMLLCAVPETLGGLWLVVRHYRSRSLPQALLGTALLILGCGRLLLGIELLVSDARYPNIFYGLSHLSVVFAVPGVMLLPRPRTEPLQGLRSLVEGLVLASALTILLEVAWLEAIFGGALTRAGLTAIAIVLSTSWLLGIGLAILVREQERWIGWLTVAVGLLLTADLLTWQAVWTDGGQFPWAANVVTLPVWLLAISGALATADPPRPVSAALRPRREHRRNLLFSGTVFAILVTAGLMMMNRPQLAPMRVLTSLVFVTALMARDVVRSQQNTRLLTRLSVQGRTDPLTGLGNRLALAEYLEAAASSGRPVHVLTVDLDGFKHVNTQYGLSAGDRVLVEVATLLTARLTGLGECFRLGGDEFAVVVGGGPQVADEAAERVHDAVAAASRALADLGTLALSGSVGVDTWVPDEPPDSALPATLTRSSHAMMTAKQRGRSRTVRYDEEMSLAHRRELRLQSRLAAALDGDDEPFKVVFQPMLSCEREVLAVEALARWTDDELGEVPPQEFIAAAEAAGLIDKLGDRIIALAVQAFTGTVAAPQGVGLALNVSTIQLRHPGFVTGLTAVAGAHGLSPRQVLVEITESVFVHPQDPAVSALSQLSAAGFAIAVDDFGAGYSSLGYLGRLPVDVVKIDASLVRQLDQPRAVAIVRGVVDIAGALGLGVVAEGIESLDQLLAAVRLGVPVAQGYLTGRPTGLDEIAPFATLGGAAGPWRRFVPDGTLKPR